MDCCVLEKGSSYRRKKEDVEEGVLGPEFHLLFVD